MTWKIRTLANLGVGWRCENSLLILEGERLIVQSVIAEVESCTQLRLADTYRHLTLKMMIL